MILVVQDLGVIIIVHAEGTADGGIFHYTYQYNNGKTPVFMQHDIEGLPSVSITY